MLRLKTYLKFKEKNVKTFKPLCFGGKITEENANADPSKLLSLV